MSNILQFPAKKAAAMTKIEKTDHHAAGAQAEKARIRAILESPEAVGRKNLAEHLAFETDNHEAWAVAILKRAPREPGAT